VHKPTDIDDTIRDQSSVAAYNKGKLKLYFQGQIRYKDILGVDHCTKVCMYHVHGRQPNIFYGCSEGNQMDTDSPKSKEKGNGAMDVTTPPLN
jgi:hypothetical protein